MCLHERTAFKVLPCWSVSCQSVFMSCTIMDRHIAKSMTWMELLLELQRPLFSRLTCLNVPGKPQCQCLHKNMQKHQHDPLRNITLQYLCGWRHISAHSCSMCGPYQNWDKSTSCQMLARLFTHQRKTSPTHQHFILFYAFYRGKKCSVSVWAATWWHRGWAEGGVHLSRSVLLLLLLLAAAPAWVQRIGRWWGHLGGESAHRCHQHESHLKVTVGHSGNSDISATVLMKRPNITDEMNNFSVQFH